MLGKCFRTFQKPKIWKIGGLFYSISLFLETLSISSIVSQSCFYWIHSMSLPCEQKQAQKKVVEGHQLSSQKKSGRIFSNRFHGSPSFSCSMWCLCSVYVKGSSNYINVCLFSFAQTDKCTNIHSNSIVPLPQSEYNALWELYNSTNGLEWDWSSAGQPWTFSANADPCTDNWQGVQCSIQNESSLETFHVSNLSLSMTNLQGMLPESLGDLGEEISVIKRLFTS